MAAPTILAFGTDEQKQRYLRPLWCGEEVWCQLFSEPGAGSDLAGLATRAVLDGDTWIVNGQKVWTSSAHIADRGDPASPAPTPTSPSTPACRYFVLDMHDPGVEVRPLRQITGEAEFNEVFLTDARIPDTDRLGEVGEGWKVANATLSQRARRDRRRRVPARVRHGHERRADLARAPRAAHARDPRAAAARLDRHRGRPDHGHPAAPEAGRRRTRPGGVGDEAVVRADQPGALRRSRSTCSPTTGCGTTTGRCGGPTHVDFFGKDAGYRYLRAKGNSIEGGTSEVLRNVVAERVLGLPTEHRVDKDVPWKDLPR